MTIDLRALGLVCGLLAVAACERIPAYDESLGWFSRSEYDPEIKAIERRIPPPDDSSAAAPSSGAAALLGPGGLGEGGAILQPAWMPTVRAPVEGGTGATRHEPVASATLAPRARIVPLGGYARAQRVIDGTNRGPISGAGLRTPR